MLTVHNARHHLHRGRQEMFGGRLVPGHAVLDVDWHRGNGTQSIFCEDSDVSTVSLHADPRTEHPFFLGHADECDAGPGEGFER